MVNKLAEIEPRSSGETVVTDSDTGDDFFRPEQLRSTWVFQNDLDEYAEVTIDATHSQDTSFSNSLTHEEGLPLRPGTVRETAYLNPNEIVQFIVDTPTAPSSGSLTIWQEKDNTPVGLKSETFNRFKELNEGRTYTVDFQESLTDGSTITAGIRNPSDATTNVFVQQFGLSVGGDGLVTTEIDHGSYTDGSSLTVINKKPELQVERPLNASITKNPTTSNLQASMQAFLPGGSAGGTATGNRFAQADYELNPGQDLTVQLQNDSGTDNRFGFSLAVIETVVR